MSSANRSPASFIRKGSLIVSFIGISLFTLSAELQLGSIGWISLTLSLAFPAVLFLSTHEGCQKWVIVYVTLLSITIASFLAIRSKYPTGFSDVFVHLRVTQHLYVNGVIEFFSQPSVNFVGLYIFGVKMSKVLAIPTEWVAGILPIFTFLLLTSTFIIVCRLFLFRSSDILFATIIFMTSWVYRFNVEYRTLNVALPLYMATIFFIFKDPEIYPPIRYRIMIGILTVGIIISHFTTAVFFIIVVFTITLYYILHGLSQDRGTTFTDPKKVRLPFFISTFATLLLLAYMNFLGESFQNLLLSTVLSGLDTPKGGSPGEEFFSLISIKYLSWVAYAGFIVSSLIVGLSYLRNRDRFIGAILAILVPIGVIAVLSRLANVVLNPGRILLYGSVPYAIVYALGLSDNSRGALNHLKSFMKILVVASVLSTVVLQIPSNIFSEDDKNVKQGVLEINEMDYTASDFLKEYGLRRYDVKYDPEITSEDSYRALFEYEPTSSPSRSRYAGAYYITYGKWEINRKATIYDAGGVTIASKSTPSEHES